VTGDEVFHRDIGGLTALEQHIRELRDNEASVPRGPRPIPPRRK
jgi:hypothetical protein